MRCCDERSGGREKGSCGGVFGGFFTGSQTLWEEEVYEAYAQGVEGGPAVDEYALESEIPEERDDKGYGETGYGVACLGRGCEAFGDVPFGQEVEDSVSAEGVEENAADPDEGVLYSDRFAGTSLGVEGEPVVYDTVDDTAGYGAYGSGDER